MLGLPEMRLVTYDRRGHRRLGAILDGRVVDLPDAVGHPAFPTTRRSCRAAGGRCWTPPAPPSPAVT